MSTYISVGRGGILKKHQKGNRNKRIFAIRKLRGISENYTFNNSPQHLRHHYHQFIVIIIISLGPDSVTRMYWDYFIVNYTRHLFSN